MLPAFLLSTYQAALNYFELERGEQQLPFLPLNPGTRRGPRLLLLLLAQ